MALLGIVLHAAQRFTMTSIHNVENFGDEVTQLALEISGHFIHLFRMPIFFLVAGFFGAYLYCQRGIKEFIHNRLKHVFLPLLLAWLIVFPVCRASYLFRISIIESKGPGALNSILSDELFNNFSLMHLWFLYDLLIIYGMALLIIWSFRRLQTAC